MMNSIVAGMVGFLSGTPDPLLAAARLGDRLPSSSGDVPAVAMSLAVESTRGTGMGRFRKEGHQLLRNTAMVLVQASPATFSTDLKTLQLAPLPLRNPGDVQVVRVTGPNQPVTYQAADRPAAVDQFLVDALRARLIFGAPQPVGEQLQVTHWTVDFRDDITGGRCQGTITLEVWGGNPTETSTLAQQLQTKLASGEAGLRQSGFASLTPATLEAAENVTYQPATGSTFPVWRQRLAYRFHFDLEQGGETSSGGPIQKINVNMDDAVIEAFSTPSGS
jgi:hypothetical protein